MDCVLALRLQRVLEVRDPKAARKRLWKPIDNTLVKSFTVVPREVLKSNVDSSIRFDEHACHPRSDVLGRPETALDFHTFFILARKKGLGLSAKSLI